MQGVPRTGEKPKDYDHLFKIVIVGDSGTGKSCLLLRFTDDNYNDVYISTIGVDFKFRSMRMNSKNIKLQIWDTAGQERFRNITSSFYRGAHGIVLVYDITNQDSFNNVSSWLADIERHHGSADQAKPCIILVGNKNDLSARKVVRAEQAQKLAERNGLLWIETSAKDSSNVETAFINLVSDILAKVESGAQYGQKAGGTVAITNNPTQSQGGGWCC
eukprot:TRINITY_DN1898_c0_g1_i1.p1 TRINITY_DN1898_c0_g1~~TRINITY_DN1898_c0_g1_i1.p1  ORF type:complete len:217 (+),score=41.60 TRINITY_DN1898_c0_g1_i1:113-763(+)